MKTTSRCLIVLFLFASLAVTCRDASAAGPSSASAILDQAKAQAAAQGKAIFLIFGASWCPWCRQLDKFINSGNIAPIINKYFVIARIDVQERGDKKRLDTPGGAGLETALGGKNDGGLPFFAFLDASGKLIVNSLRPVPGESDGANIGHPVQPEEVDWFMTMLSRAAPGLTPDEARAVEDDLRHQKKD